MKSLQEFKLNLTEEEKQDYSKFDALIRAGLGNKAQIQRLHTILGKMGEDKPNFSPADRAIIQNIFNKMETDRQTLSMRHPIFNHFCNK